MTTFWLSDSEQAMRPAARRIPAERRISSSVGSPSHLLPPKDVAQLAFDDECGDGRDEVQGAPHPDEDQDGGEEPGGVGLNRHHLTVSHGGEGDGRHVEGTHETGRRVDDREADDADQGDEDQEREGLEQAPPKLPQVLLPLRRCRLEVVHGRHGRGETGLELWRICRGVGKGASAQSLAAPWL